ncbi:AAA family ATPase [Clostridium sp. P21]|uniref:AAA family ATPase n=1 Tax=Clostridium muellerianum TaxID=2716538 RepID=A0A7Y0EJ71_9CLOT|nr:AAA family ATPase [Clostridium muellerianum]NMM64463.1 AAA family ATPase [Clostridium muellerianum]
MKKSKIISIINYKGGVAKTTSAFNIAVGLNYLNNNKVLLIDLDPQCSLSVLCLKSYSRKIGNDIKLEKFNCKNTINSVIHDYLLETRLRISPNIDLNTLILKDFYCTNSNTILKNLDVIPSTMFDTSDSSYPKGLDDLEIEIAMQQMGEDTLLNRLTILAKFFKDTALDEKYDFIIFDCPPANNIITQNALIVSDYYLIPTIMDEMSSSGTSHLYNLINQTIFKNIFNKYSTLISSSDECSYLNYLKKGYPKLLGIFETLKIPGSNSSETKNMLLSKVYFKNKIFENEIYSYIDAARITGKGLSFFSKHISRDNPPHISYGGLIKNILRVTSSKINLKQFNANINIPF